jgi:hypothetical protein
MARNILLITAFLYVLSVTHAVALDRLGNTEGSAGDSNNIENASHLCINGTKFEDLNGNGRFDGDERGLSGWVIRLKLDGREISNTTTDDSGRYSFTNLEPGKYTVVEDQDAGWEQSFPGSGYYTINLIAENANKVNFGSSRFSKTSDGDDVKVDQDDMPYFPGMPGTYEEERKAAERAPPTYIPPD